MLTAPDRPTGSTISVQPSDGGVRLHRWTRTHEVPVAEGSVDSADGGPHFVLPRRRRREAGAVAGVGPIPAVREQIGERVRRVLQQVVLSIGFAGLDFANLAANRD